jgi:hypothetical protein
VPKYSCSKNFLCLGNIAQQGGPQEQLTQALTIVTPGGWVSISTTDSYENHTTGKNGIERGEYTTEKVVYYGGSTTYQRSTQNQDAQQGIFDERGKELFDHWLGGTGKTLNFLNGVWGDYMKKNGSLANQIYSALTKDANSRTASGRIDLRFHAELAENDYQTGYGMLHGTDRTVGDFQIWGDARLNAEGSVSYDLLFIWNDKINPNSNYIMDTILSGALAPFSPKDYDIHIAWTNQFYIIKDE